MRTCILMGPPGSGKTTMYLKTLPRDAYPILVIDADRKLRSMPEGAEAITRGEAFVWELDEPLNEGKLAMRLRALAKNEKPLLPPKGWIKFAQFAEDLEKRSKPGEELLPQEKARSITIDSATVVGAHAMRAITYEDPKGVATLSPRDWAYYLMTWQETMTEFVDFCKKRRCMEQGCVITTTSPPSIITECPVHHKPLYDKNLIWCVHQRVGETPLENNKVIKSRGEGGVVNREYLGTMQVKIVPSIQGQFGLEMGAYADEVYGLDVVLDKDGKPRWVCRVVPDGRRDLRTSVPGISMSETVEFEPDFRKIWGFKPSPKK